jgi:hypothetical protein
MLGEGFVAALVRGYEAVGIEEEMEFGVEKLDFARFGSPWLKGDARVVVRQRDMS